MEFYNIAFVAQGLQDHQNELHVNHCGYLCGAYIKPHVFPSVHFIILKVAVIDSQDHRYGVTFHFLCQIESFYVNAPSTCESNDNVKT